METNIKTHAELVQYLDQCFSMRSHAQTEDDYLYFDAEIQKTLDQILVNRVNNAVAKDIEGF